MTPSTEHEQEIVATVERVAQKILGPPTIHDIIATITFTMSRSDMEFLVRYLQWRRDHPPVDSN